MTTLNISRVGEPRLVSSGGGSVQDKYEIDTTPLPGYPRGYNWVMCFGKHLTGGDFLARHDGVNMIFAECWPDAEPQLAEAVDAAIEKANEQEGAMSYD